jgi:hypothetical protein
MTENDMGINDKGKEPGVEASVPLSRLLTSDSYLYPLRLCVSAGEIPSYSWGPGRKLKWGSYLITVP